MYWYVLLTYKDGTEEKMYCDTRETARERTRFYRTCWMGTGNIGKPLDSVKVVRSA